MRERERSRVVDPGTETHEHTPRRARAHSPGTMDISKLVHPEPSETALQVAQEPVAFAPAVPAAPPETQIDGRDSLYSGAPNGSSFEKLVPEKRKGHRDDDELDWRPASGSESDFEEETNEEVGTERQRLLKKRKLDQEAQLDEAPPSPDRPEVTIKLFVSLAMSLLITMLMQEEEDGSWVPENPAEAEKTLRESPIFAMVLHFFDLFKKVINLSWATAAVRFLLHASYYPVAFYMPASCMLGFCVFVLLRRSCSV